MNHPFSNRSKRTLCRLAGAALILCGLATAQAQDLELTPEEMARLQSLSAEQRAEALGNATTVSSGASQEQLAEPAPIAQRNANVTATQNSIEDNAREVQRPERLQEDVERAMTPDPLRQFGYELFAGTPTTFAPATNIPVPLNYVIGPNDTVIIQLYGQRNARYELVVTREGDIQFPEIGPLNVAGLTFEEMRELIDTTVANSLIGQQVSITMGALRSIQIFVLGEAFRPGSYTISSLSTMTNALFSSGGVTRVGSLRDIRLMRQGQLVTSLDLYDLLLRGDTSGDVRLQPNDVIFIPPIGRTFGIAGNVRRPAIFELTSEETLSDVLPLGGGFLPTAFPAASRIERINELGERTIVDVDLSQEDVLALNVRDGDLLQIYSILDQVEGVVLLEGYVNRPGGFAWREGLRVSDILPNVEDMLPNPDLDYALIAREVPPTRTLEILYVNLRQALANPGSAFDLPFEPRDRLLVFGVNQSRQNQLAGLLDQLRGQASFDDPARIVSIAGNVDLPGNYPLSEGLTVNELIRFAGGLGNNAYLDYLVLEREVDNQGRTEIQALSLDSLSLGTPTPVAMQSMDRLFVFNANQPRADLLDEVNTRLRNQASFRDPARLVTIRGNVRFPGTYPMTEGMVLGDLLDAAGGLRENTDVAYSLLVREIDEFGRIETIGTSAGDSNGYFIDRSQPLQAGDVQLVFNANAGRQEDLEPFLTRLRSQANEQQFAQVVSVSGDVRFPGDYPLHAGLDAGALVRAAGGYLQSAEIGNAEIARVRFDEADGRDLDTFSIDLTRPGPTGIDAALQPFDTLVVGRLPNWTEIQRVSVAGEVRSPGTYVIGKNETLSEVIARAGGLTEFAAPRAAIFLREDVRNREASLIAEYREQLRQAMITRNLNPTARENQNGISTELFNELLAQVQPTGRLVINLQDALNSPRGDGDVLLEGGDRLIVPAVSQEVTVLGEVQRPTTHLYNRRLSIGDYIARSGGVTENANQRGIFVIKASGDVLDLRSGRWFFESDRYGLEPGDSIVVPFRIRPGDPLYTWTSVSQVLFNMATTVLAIDNARN